MLYQFTDLLDIDRKQIEIVTTPTQFKKVIVPEPSTILNKQIKKEYLEIIDKICSNVSFKEAMDNVFLSNKYLNNKRRINEQQIEEIFNLNGYKSYYPNLLSLREQIAIIKSAKNFVTVEGTSSHMLLFLNSNANCVILKRNRVGNKTQTKIDKIKGYNVEYIKSFVSFWDIDFYAPAILGLTDDLIDYFNRNGMKYIKKDIDQKEILTYICNILDYVKDKKIPLKLNEENIKYMTNMGNCKYVNILVMLKCLFYRYANKKFGLFKNKTKYYKYTYRMKIGFFTITI